MRSWDVVAPLYDLQLVLERSAIQTALDFAQPCSTDRLLDVATGSGVVLPAPPHRLAGAPARARRDPSRARTPGRLVTVTPVAPPTTFGAAAVRIAGRYLLDPRADLERAGFMVRTARYVRAGYPSVCVLARRS
jgi:hypothetical protein